MCIRCMGCQRAGGPMDPGGGSCHVYPRLQGGKDSYFIASSRTSKKEKEGEKREKRKKKRNCIRPWCSIDSGEAIKVESGVQEDCQSLKGCKHPSSVGVAPRNRIMSVRGHPHLVKVNKVCLKRKISTCQGRWLKSVDVSFWRSNTGQLRSETALASLWGCEKLTIGVFHVFWLFFLVH